MFPFFKQYFIFPNVNKHLAVPFVELRSSISYKEPSLFLLFTEAFVYTVMIFSKQVFHLECLLITVSPPLSLRGILFLKFGQRRGHEKIAQK